MKLYRVEVTKVIYCVALSDEDAAIDGQVYADEESTTIRVRVDPATKKGVAEDGWGKSLIYGVPSDMTAYEVMASQL